MLTEFNPPDSTGVYLMKGKKGKILYIGKAKNLENRIKSYLNKNHNDRYQVNFLIGEIKDIEFIVTRNERDAFLLENTLIKKHKPKYNIQLKDDKTYFLLKLDLNHEFPRLYFTRRQTDDNSLYLGPFSSADSLKKTKRLLHRMFPLRDCTHSKFLRHNDRPCINYNMKLCSGPCAKRITAEDYKSIVDRFELYTRGKFTEIIKILRENMREASRDLKFEDAAMLRDQLEFLNMHLDHRGLVNSLRKSRDILGIYSESGATSIVILFYRNGSIIDKSEYYFDNVVGDQVQLLEEFIISYYSSSQNFPIEINLPFKLSDMSYIEEWINMRSRRKVKINVPLRGKKLEDIKLANGNAINTYERHSIKSSSIKNMLKYLKTSLHLKRIPHAIECYDISNIQGREPVASLVRFENGLKIKEKFKRYRIKTVTCANDFAMIKEVVSRRLRRHDQEGWELPDLFLIDGGPGQLSFAKAALDETNHVGNVDLVAIAKGRSREKADRIYVWGNEEPFNFDKNSNELLYFMRIRDEAHRFALDYHKKLRKQKSVLSEYESIPNIGKIRMKILQRNFGSLKNIKDHSVTEIASVKGLNRKVAESIKEYLRTMNL